MRLGQRQEQLEAGLPLAALEARQRALGDPGRRRERGQGDAAPRREAASSGGRPRPGRSGSPASSPPRATLMAVPGNSNGSCASRRALVHASSAMESETYDVAIVGGGAAGLSAALVLGRARRRVAVVDAGTPRNAPAAHMHGFLSRDGMPPAELLAAGRAEVPRYGVELVDDRVVDDRRPASALRLASGRALQARRRARSRPAPTTSCPTSPAPASAGAATSCTARTATAGRCATSRSASLGTGPGSVEHAQLLRQWSDDVIFFAHTYAVTADERAALDSARHRGRRRARRAARRRRRSAATPCSSPTVGASRAPRSSSGPRFAHTRDGLLASLGCELDEAGFVSRRRRRARRACPASGSPATPATHARR